MLRAFYQEHDITGTCEEAATVPGDDFLPYYDGRTDDRLAMADAAAAAPRAYT